MVHDLKNKVVIITGAATGIGSRVVRKLVAENVKLIGILDIAEKQGLELQDELNAKYEKVKFIKCDVTNDDQLYAAFDAVVREGGTLDILINNAGILNDNLNTYRLQIDLNVKALITSTIKGIDIMSKEKGGNGGVVINISSIAALSQLPETPIYCGTKTAVLQFSNCVGMEQYYSRNGVRVIAVCYGATDTPLLHLKNMGNFDSKIEEDLPELLNTLPLQKPDDAANGLVEVLKKGDSGTTWLINKGKPAEDITSVVKQAYEIVHTYMNKMYEVADKVVLVTGGAAGIGAGIVRAFLDDGAKHVAALDVDVNNGKALETELSAKHGSKKIKFYKCDVTTEDLHLVYDSILKEFGYIDVVVNCAGIMNDSPNMYQKEIAVNVTALITSSLKAHKLMNKDEGGRGGTIINIASIVALFQTDLLPVYAATKSAVLQFSNGLGMENNYLRTGVRVVTLCFGVTDTSLISSTKVSSFDPKLDATMMSIISTFPIQSTESAVRGLMAAYKDGASGSTWLVSSNDPAKDITANINEGYEIFARGFKTALVTSSLKAHKLMSKEEGGRGGTIINVASIMALLRTTLLPIYAATKSAVLHFSSGLGMEKSYVRTAVRVITICFGVTDTSLLSSTKVASYDPKLDTTLMAAMKAFPIQSPESAVRGLMVAYKEGSSGSTWLVTSDKPAEDITANINEGYDIFSRGVYH
ncbi:LOW QUALITY PROTEIN: putative short-chain type dehydrogenase/reductase y4vI [Aphomia sociella]